MFDARYLWPAAVIILLLLAWWIASVIFVIRDSRRRQNSVRRRIAWALLSLVPVLGLILYLLFGRTSIREQERRVTRLKAPERGAPSDPPTVTVSEYLREAQSEKTLFRPERPRPGRYLVTVIGGPQEGQTFVIGHLPAMIGRIPDSTIRLVQDMNVSRRHAELYVRDGELRLRDLNSTHGTRVNNLPISDRAVAPGDEIRVGRTLLVILA